MKLYGDRNSGNCYKVQLLMSLCDIPHEWIPVDILANETHTPDFLAKNPVGQIPLLELDDGRVLSESNAILHYLAAGTPYWPDDHYHRAQVLQWQGFEQYSHEPYIAVARFIRHYLDLPEEREAEYEAKQAGGYRALDVMEQHLASHPWFVGGQCSIADISLFAYTHVAHQGGFDLAAYPAIRSWIERVESMPGYSRMGT